MKVRRASMVPILGVPIWIIALVIGIFLTFILPFPYLLLGYPIFIGGMIGLLWELGLFEKYEPVEWRMRYYAKRDAWFSRKWISFWEQIEK